MEGYIYDINTRKIATKIDNVIACNDTVIKGDSIAILGTGKYIITDSEYNEGDILPNEIVDKRSNISVLSIE